MRENLQSYLFSNEIKEMKLENLSVATKILSLHSSHHRTSGQSQMSSRIAGDTAEAANDFTAS